MDYIKQRLIEVGRPKAAIVKDLEKRYGDVVLQQITVDQVLGGMKGMTGLITDTSNLDPEEGIRFRGYSIPELREKLPKAHATGEPLPEGLFYLMLIGELPTEADVKFLSQEWEIGRASCRERVCVPV